VAARLLTQIGGGDVYELDDPYSQPSLQSAAAEGQKHLRLTQGQEDVLAEARALLTKTDKDHQVQS
jgi:hypothetical protein